MKYAILVFTAILSLLVDQWTKYFVDTRFRWGESINVIPDVFTLTYVRNRGAAFGIMHATPQWFREPFFVVVPVVALFVIVFLIARLEKNQYATAGGLSLILGGAVGNLIDRLRFGYVIDFLDFHWKEVYHWPAFNVADACIVVGVSIMFTQSLFFQNRGDNSPKEKVF